MDKTTRVAVCSRSFSQNPKLRQELLTQFSNVKFNETGKQFQGSELIDFLKEADRAIIALEDVTESLLASLPQLKVIGKYGVGLDKIDFRALKKYSVKMGWSPGVNAPAVAELTLAMALTIIRRIQVSAAVAQAGQWKQISGRQLSSMTYGILGCGHVGRALAKLLAPFGCKVLVCDIQSQPEFYKAHNLEEVSLEKLLTQSDIVSIHIPKNSQTMSLLNQSRLHTMKKGSYLINTARGGLADESTVLAMLNSNHLAGAAFDVFEKEPPIHAKDLIAHPHCLSTTDIGGSSEEAVLAMGRAAITGLSTATDGGEYEKYR